MLNEEKNQANESDRSLSPTQDRWWADKDYHLDMLEYGDRACTALCGRQVEGEWEYAIVEWRYYVPTLRRRFKGGQILESDES